MDRRAKIVCTMGPATTEAPMVKKLINAGMNVARINFSHGTQEENGRQIDLINQCAKSLGKHVGILMDLKGPKIRVGQFEGKTVHFQKGDRVVALMEEVLGNKERFTIRQKELFADVHDGDRLLVDDGKVILKILKAYPDRMELELLNDGDISDNKGINAPGVVLSMPFVSEKDRKDLLFGIRKNVNIVACSFVRRAQDVLEIRKILDENGGKDIEIVAKIENQEGVDNVKSIIEVANGIMVARGDMGVELPLEEVPLYQKKIIRACNEAGKPVITATHMLESMIHCPRPTRAEAGDVANAVLDGTDATMLSGESAMGDYPEESVLTMASIISKIETVVHYEKKFEWLIKHSGDGINDAIGVSISSCCLTIKGAKAIFAFTETGGTAKRISRFRPALPIYACTEYERTCQKLQYYWGIEPILVRKARAFLEFDDIAREEAFKLGFKKGDVIILASGFGVEHGQTNTIRLLYL